MFVLYSNHFITFQPFEYEWTFISGVFNVINQKIEVENTSEKKLWQSIEIC